MAAPEESVRLHLYCPSIKPAKSASNWAECVGQHNHKSYTDEALAEYGPNVQRARWCFGDNIELMSCPTVVKSRKIGDPNAILLPLNARRHWGRSTAGLPARIWTPETLSQFDIPFSRKRSRIVWRGGTTGGSRNFDQHPRTQLVKRWFGHARDDIDVAYHEIVQGKSELRDYIRQGMSLQNQLENAFIVAVEGNDVATNLKWILASNSVPIMPPPQYESWLLESMLLPMQHYVPCLPDMSDLDTVLAWCRRNPTKCEEISQNGKIYMRSFLDVHADRKLSKAVLERYLGGPMRDFEPKRHRAVSQRLIRSKGRINAGRRAAVPSTASSRR